MDSLFEEARLALHAVWQRRWLALGVAWGIALVGWAGVALVPNRYESRARIYVSMSSILPNKIGITDAERQQGIDRVRQTLTSAVNLEKVVRGTDLSLQANSDADVAALVARLGKAITIKDQQNNLFEISARSSMGGLSDAANARTSRAIVAKLIDLFVEGNLAGNRQETSQTLSFLDDQLKEREQQLQDAEQKKADFEARYMGMLPGAGSVDDRLQSARSELDQLQSNLVAAQSSLSAVNAQMAGTPATVPGPNIVINAGTPAGVRGRIAELQVQLADDAARGWTDQHPDVIALRQQIARLQSQAATEHTPSAAGGGNVQNPLYASLRSMQADRQANVAALTARKAQLDQELAGFTAKQAQEPDVAAEEARLTRDYQVLKDQYDKLLADREDVRLRSDVQSQTDSVEFKVIDPPSLPRSPVAPNRPMLIAAVLVLALGGGIAAAFLQAKLAPSFPTAARLSAAAGRPVIGAISQVVTPAGKAEERHRLAWFGGGAGALFACSVLLILVELVQQTVSA